MFLQNLFKSSSSPGKMQYAKLLDGYTPVFSQFGKDIYASDIVQMCIDIIATECSKLSPKHIRTDNKDYRQNVNDGINKLLKYAPNELMTTKDFIEKIIWQLYLNYNAFIYPTYDVITDVRGNVSREYTGLYPLNPVQVDFMQDVTGKLFVKMTFASTENFTIAYSEIIHLRKKFSINDVMGGGMNGQPDNTAILKVLEINDTLLQGLGKAIKSSLAVRGIIKINSLMDDEKQKAERDRFEQMIRSGQTGIAALDLKGDYIDIKPDIKLVDKDTLQFLQEKVLFYYGVSLPILSGDFTDEQYQAFYEKTLEPLIISLGQAFTKTLFTQRELDFGNEIVFYPQKLLFTNTKNKIAVADILGNRGALSNNELLDLFGYPPYDGGDGRFMSLNFIDSKLAEAYQMSQIKSKLTGGNTDGKE